MIKRLRPLSLMALALTGCGMQDSDYYPYALSGLDSWVHDNETGRDYYAGRVDSSYFGRTEVAARCRDLAVSMARVQSLDSWGYVCCTVTWDSECVTKVR